MFINDKELEYQKIKAESFFDMLINDYHFNEYLNESKAFYAWYDEYNEKFEDETGLKLLRGACRIVIPFDKYAYKFNFLGETIDYCAEEAYAYQKAIDAGCDEAFCPITFLTHINGNDEYSGFDVYIVPVCEIDDLQNSDDSYDYHFRQECEALDYDPENLSDEQRDEVESYMSDEYEDTEGMCEFASSKWDDGLYGRTMDLIDELEIRDLHYGNWGYLNGKFVIVDYAGYAHRLYHSSIYHNRDNYYLQEQEG